MRRYVPTYMGFGGQVGVFMIKVPACMALQVPDRLELTKFPDTVEPMVQLPPVSTRVA